VRAFGREHHEVGILRRRRELAPGRTPGRAGSYSRLADGFRPGCAVSQGIAGALVGPVNVGKSSPLNALVGRERALVVATPGTTRDWLEVADTWGGGGLAYQVRTVIPHEQPRYASSCPPRRDGCGRALRGVHPVRRCERMAGIELAPTTSRCSKATAAATRETPRMNGPGTLA